MRLTLAQVLAHNDRVAAGRRGSSPIPAPTEGCEQERKLHGDILAECLRRGWLPFHGAMSYRTHRTEGEPDFIILAEERVILVECKRRTGKLTKEQQCVKAHAETLGHTVHVVRSFAEFLEVVKP